MSLTSENMSPADLRAVMGNNDDGFGFGGNGAWWLIVLLLFGWGRNGYGFGGFGGNGAGCGAPCATQADVRAAVDQQTLISKIDQQTYGTATAYNGVIENLNANFRNIDNAVCTLGYQGAQHASNLSAQLAQCCCDTRAAIQDNTTSGVMNTNALSRQISDCCCDLEKMNMQNRFDAQAYNCNTLQAIDKLGDRIIDYMSNEKMQSLRDENQALRLAASQERQNQYLISQLGYQCPKPAYVVQPPQQVTFPTNCCGGVNYAAYNGGCGCNNGCGC